jgi:hypothetical protein
MINNNFTVVVDTREQTPWSFQHYAKANKKLDTGDYSIEGLEDIFCIERKKSVSEVANNIIESRFNDVLLRLEKIPYSYILLEFSLSQVLSFPIGSSVPQKLWNKIKVRPPFILKNITDWQIKHNIKVFFCDSSSNAETLAEYLMKKIYYIYNKEKNNET